MIYRNRPNFIIAVISFLVCFCFLYMGGLYIKIAFTLILCYGFYDFTEDQINEKGILKLRVLLFYKEFIPFSRIDKVVCPCIPNILKGGSVSNRLLFYSGKKNMEFNSVFTDSKEDIAKVKRILHFLESKGIKVYLVVPFGEVNKQMFTGFEVIKRMPD